MDTRKLQQEVNKWSEKNFGKVPYWYKVLGVVEEVGELAHSLLKQENQIRGSHSEHEENAKDAVGDITLFLIGLCAIRGWDFEEIVTETWDKVKQRDWKSNPRTGE